MDPLRYGVGKAPLAIAHRGGAALAPENTRAAFDRAYALGFRYLETDVRLTRDGTLVAFHDATLDRVTGVHGRLAKTRDVALAQLTVFGAQPVPTMSSLLTAYPDARFTIDLKPAAALQPLADALIASGTAHRVCVAGTWDRHLLELRSIVGPDLTVALGWRSLVGTLTRLRSGRRCNPDLAGVFAHVPLRLGKFDVVVDDLLRRAHDNGIRLIVWTVNDPDTMHHLLDHGVDGIITDRPDLLREVLIRRDQWQAPAGQPSPVA